MNCSSSCAIAGEAKAVAASNVPEKAAVENAWRFMNTPLYLDVMSIVRWPHLRANHAGLRIQNVFKTICYQHRQLLSAFTTLAKKNLVGEIRYIKPANFVYQPVNTSVAIFTV
jgi:hypothetical protein